MRTHLTAEDAEGGWGWGGAGRRGPARGAHLRLHHGRPLGPQHLHGLEDVHDALVPHALQHDAERDEHARPAYAGTGGGEHSPFRAGCPAGPPVTARVLGPGESPNPRAWARLEAALAGPQFSQRGARDSSPAVDGDGTVLAELFLGLVHLADEVNEALPRLWHALLRPVRELELPDRPGLAVLE